jgi:hypothetical protein
VLLEEGCSLALQSRFAAVAISPHITAARQGRKKSRKAGRCGDASSGRTGLPAGSNLLSSRRDDDGKKESKRFHQSSSFPRFPFHLCLSWSWWESVDERLDVLEHRRLRKLQPANMANPLRSLTPTKLQPHFYRCFHTRRRCVPRDAHLRDAFFQPCRLRQLHFRRTLVVQQVGPQMPSPPNEADGPESAREKEPEKHDWGLTMFKMAEAALTTFASVAILGCVSLSFSNLS